MDRNTKFLQNLLHPHLFSGDIGKRLIFSFSGGARHGRLLSGTPRDQIFIEEHNKTTRPPVIHTTCPVNIRKALTIIEFDLEILSPIFDEPHTYRWSFNDTSMNRCRSMERLTHFIHNKTNV